MSMEISISKCIQRNSWENTLEVFDDKGLKVVQNFEKYFQNYFQDSQTKTLFFKILDLNYQEIMHLIFIFLIIFFKFLFLFYCFQFLNFLKTNFFLKKKSSIFQSFTPWRIKAHSKSLCNTAIQFLNHHRSHSCLRYQVE